MSGDPLNTALNIYTYGAFGLGPRNGVCFTTPLTHVRATTPYSKGAKFMNLEIQTHWFIFYLEKYDAEFLLPEYFEHLNDTAVKKRQ